MKQKDVLIILALLFVFVTMWVGYSIYRNVTKSTISESINQNISPITSTFDSKTIDKLKQRQRINPSFEIENTTPTPSASNEAQPAL